MSRTPLEYDLARPAVLANGPIPPKIEVNEGVLRNVDPAGTAQVLDSDRYLADLCQTWIAAITKPNGRKKALVCFAQMTRAMRFFLTRGAKIPAKDLPNSSAQVLPAVAAVEKVFPIIQDEARFAVRHLPLDEAHEIAGLVVDLQDLRAAHQALDGDVDGTVNLCLDHLHEVVRVFDHKTAPLIEDDSEVATLLYPVDMLLRGAARRGAQTRKVVEKVTTDLRNERAEAANTSAKATDPQPGSSTPVGPRTDGNNKR